MNVGIAKGMNGEDRGGTVRRGTLPALSTGSAVPKNEPAGGGPTGGSRSGLRGGDGRTTAACLRAGHREKDRIFGSRRSDETK